MSVFYEEANKVTVCPYCMDEQGDKLSCCGEVHFETAYLINDEYILESEVSDE